MAELLASTALAGADVHISVEQAEESDLVREVAMSCALHTFANALSSCKGSPRVHLDLGGALLQPRLLTLLMAEMRISLGQATELGALVVEDCGGSAGGASQVRLCQADGEALQSAASASWRARSLAFLLGAHPRVGVASPVRLLPLALIHEILDRAAIHAAVRVEVLLEASAASPVDRARRSRGQRRAAAPAGAQAGGGADLDFVAAMMGSM